jgi:hypothetical protein
VLGEEPAVQILCDSPADPRVVVQAEVGAVVLDRVDREVERGAALEKRACFAVRQVEGVDRFHPPRIAAFVVRASRRREPSTELVRFDGPSE